MVIVMCVHGVDHQEASLTWQQIWEDIIRQQLATVHPDAAAPEIKCTAYDDLLTPVLSKHPPRMSHRRSASLEAERSPARGPLPWISQLTRSFRHGVCAFSLETQRFRRLPAETTEEPNG